MTATGVRRPKPARNQHVQHK